MSGEELKTWPGYEEHFTSGFVKHKGYTHMARKARMQMAIKVGENGPSNLWVMSREDDKRDEVEAVMIGVFHFMRRASPLAMRLNIPIRRRTYCSVSLMLPLQRRQRSGTAMLKRCEDCIQEMMVWTKMENM